MKLDSYTDSATDNICNIARSWSDKEYALFKFQIREEIHNLAKKANMSLAEYFADRLGSEISTW